MNRDEQNFLIVGHGAIMCFLFAVHYNIEPKNYEDFRFNDWVLMGNGDVKILDIKKAA